LRRARLRSARDFAHVVDEERGAAEGGCGTGAVRVETAVRDLVSEAGDEDRGGLGEVDVLKACARLAAFTLEAFASAWTGNCLNRGGAGLVVSIA